MPVSQSQIVDLLYKQAFGVTKTDTANVKSPSNESIPSPLLIRGDTIWVQSDLIPNPAAPVPDVVQPYTGVSAIQCVADTTTVPIGGVYPTWLTNLTDWIPQEFGATYVVKVYVDNPGAANPTLTGTQIFADGSGGSGQFYYNYVSGVLNFIGETIPAALTAGKVLYVTGYRYIGTIGLSSAIANTGDITFSGSTISNDVANGNITISANGTAVLNVTSSISAAGNITAPYFIGNGSQLTGLPEQYGNANVAAYLPTYTGNLTANVISASGNITGTNFNTGGIVTASGNVYGDSLIAGTGSGGNIVGANVITANTLVANVSISSAGNITANYLIGNGSAITSVLADRGGDLNNWNTMTQMGVYTVNRVSWSGTQGTPVDSQIYNGLLEVKNSGNIAVTQIFYPGNVLTSNSQVQWNRNYWNGSWSDWYYIVNNNNVVDAGSF